MKMIIATIALAAGVGVTALVLSRSTTWRKHRRPMTFAELYEDNLYSCDERLFE